MTSRSKVTRLESWMSEKLRKEVNELIFREKQAERFKTASPEEQLKMLFGKWSDDVED